jgi:hypothetical protein
LDNCPRHQLEQQNFYIKEQLLTHAESSHGMFGMVTAIVAE